MDARRSAASLWITIGGLWLLLVGFALGIWFGPDPLGDVPEEKAWAFREIYGEVRENYVFDTDPDELIDNAIAGMVDNLDRYSSFIPERDAAQFEEQTTGQYRGVGIVMVREQSPITVLFPFSGGPAERAGIQVGDRVLAIDGEDMTQFSPQEAAGEAEKRLLVRLTGDSDPDVTLTIDREGTDPFDVVVTRGAVQRPSVKWIRLLQQEPPIGYVYMSDFQNNTRAELDRAMEVLTNEAGRPLAGLVLDLRFNEGGLLSECLGVARRFLRDGTILSMRRRGGEEIERHTASPDACKFPDLPVVLLVNERSASASEVVAGAFLDHERARLVGVRTYGKGVVQTIYRWEGVPFRLRLTTAHYYTPNGTCIERELRRDGDGDSEGGIAPHIEVAVEQDVARRIQAGLQNHEPPRGSKDAARALVDRLDVAVNWPLTIEDDAQLGAGLDEMRRVLGIQTTADLPSGTKRDERDG